MKKSLCPQCGTEQYPIVDIQSAPNSLAQDTNAAPLIIDGRMTGCDWSKSPQNVEDDEAKLDPGTEYRNNPTNTEFAKNRDGWDGIKCFDNGPETLSTTDASNLLKLMCHAR